MNEILKTEKYMFMYGPHFNEYLAIKATSAMENEDNTTGAHWNLENALVIAEEYGISFKGSKFNEYDWYVALNMIYSDYCKIVEAYFQKPMEGYVKLTEAWLNDKDIEEGKMWYYFKFIMCDEIRDEIFEDADDEELVYTVSRKSPYKREYTTREPKYKESEDTYDYKNPVYERRISKY